MFMQINKRLFLVRKQTLWGSSGYAAGGMQPSSTDNSGSGHSAVKSRKPVIGVVGAPGSGKSAVASVLGQRGGLVIDADQIARAALAEPEVVEQIVAWWGPAVVNEQTRAVDRGAVAAIVFKDDEAKSRLEALIHPRVATQRARMHAAAAQDVSVRFVVEDVPLLMENGLDEGCDAVIFVEADLALRRQRVMETRGWDADELARREAAQLPLDTKRRRADHLLQNHGPRADLETAVDGVLHQILSGASGP